MTFKIKRNGVELKSANKAMEELKLIELEAQCKAQWNACADAEAEKEVPVVMTDSKFSREDVRERIRTLPPAHSNEHQGKLQELLNALDGTFTTPVTGDMKKESLISTSSSPSWSQIIIDEFKKTGVAVEQVEQVGEDRIISQAEQVANSLKPSKVEQVNHRLMLDRQESLKNNRRAIQDDYIAEALQSIDELREAVVNLFKTPSKWGWTNGVKDSETYDSKFLRLKDKSDKMLANCYSIATSSSRGHYHSGDQSAHILTEIDKDVNSLLNNYPLGNEGEKDTTKKFHDEDEYHSGTHKIKVDSLNKFNEVQKELRSNRGSKNDPDSVTPKLNQASPLEDAVVSVVQELFNVGMNFLKK